MNETLSFRIPLDLKVKLEREAERHGMTLSNYVRTLLEQNIVIIPDEWKVIVWNVLGVDTRHINVSLKKAKSVEDFFAGILRYLDKGIQIKPILLTDRYKVGMTFKLQDKEFNVIVDRFPQIEKSVYNMIKTLEEMLMEVYDEETEEI